MTIKVIKNDDDYQIALQELERLMALTPEPDTAEFAKLEVLDLLVGDYEDREHSIPMPGPIEAIEAAMDEKGLTQRELVPYIGNASKVSEVLSGKRPLTLPMVRALSDGLAIPAKILIAESVQANAEKKVDADSFPWKDLCKLGWLKKDQCTDKAKRTNAQEIISNFLDPIGGLEAAPILRREGFRLREAKQMDPVNLTVWHAEAARRAEQEKLREFSPKFMNKKFLHELAKLSSEKNGPMAAKEQLNAHGICVIVLPHLRQTYLDGAAFKLRNGTPVVGLTLRHDRLDNFWFVLMHELAHIWKHLSDDNQIILDDLDSEPLGDDNFKAIENEADRIALDALIPPKLWDTSEAKDMPSKYAIHELAEQVGVHPSIVAGRVCHRTKQYKKFGRLLGHGEVKKALD